MAITGLVDCRRIRYNNGDCILEDDAMRTLTNIICQYCGKEKVVRLADVKRGRYKFCSRRCAMKSLTEKGKSFIQPGSFQGKKHTEEWKQRISAMRKGKNNPSWKGGKIKKVCSVCGKNFYISRYKQKIGWGIFCSIACRSAYIKGERHPNWQGGKIKKICKWCGKEFFIDPSKKGMAKFCSRKCSAEWKSVFMSGENSPLWKGGLRYDRKEEYKGDEYKLWRKSVFERDGYRCLICGKVGGRLNAHHIRSWKDFPELRFDVDNGMTMCQSCHYLVKKETPLFAIKKVEI